MPCPPTNEASAVAVRMEALARLAGGVAHDFNNVLMVINGYAELLAETVADDDSKEAAHAILDAAGRARLLTRQLLLFSRRHMVDSGDVAVAPAVASLEASLRRVVPAGVALAVHVSDPHLVVRVDPEQLEQLVLHLVANAREAMPGGGTLTVSVLGVRRAAFSDASGEQAPAGDYVRLAVADTGEGLDDGARERIFEPFFTTKAVGKGAGLTLATVYGIVKSSGGFVDVTSTAGGGSTFEVYFPLARVEHTGSVADRPARGTDDASDDGTRRASGTVAHP